MWCLITYHLSLINRSPEHRGPVLRQTGPVSNRHLEGGDTAPGTATPGVEPVLGDEEFMRRSSSLRRWSWPAARATATARCSSVASRGMVITRFRRSRGRSRTGQRTVAAIEAVLAARHDDPWCAPSERPMRASHWRGQAQVRRESGLAVSAFAHGFRASTAGKQCRTLAPAFA